MTPVRLTPLMTVAAAVVGFAGVVAPPAAAAAPVSSAPAPAQAEEPWRLSGDLAAHDPALVAGDEGENWYVFGTGEESKGGGNIQIRSSPDGKDWTYEGTVWDEIPEWITKAVPGVKNIWAPEVHEANGMYYLYYAASTWGHNNSLIGLVTNETLDPSDPDYEWVDRGEVFRSKPDDDYNAIDPAVIEDGSGKPWLAFGSYWSGIRMVELDWPSGKVADPDKKLRHIADRKADPNSIEAPYIVENDGWYYLFTSWGQCCQGVDSDYKIMVGRSKKVTGPYVDREGRKLLDGGGTTLLTKSGDRVGPGGQSVADEIIAYHYYDASADGAPRLALQPVVWGDDGWPELANQE
jgi:arabinan endo-1,5-alpha-L-arabinosidase